MEQLQSHRNFYANLITFPTGLTKESRLAAAFASTPRELYVGRGPWKVDTGKGYIETPTDDPTFLYQDIAVALKEKSELNNGRPSMHALCIAALDLQPGQRIVHVGAGTGYYTAILAKMVGESGSVDAYEVEPEFTTRAAENLAVFPQVKLHSASGIEGPLPKCDAVYVNAGATAPLAVWLDALPPMGRLLFPLIPVEGLGGMLLIIKQRMDHAPARFLCPALFAPCIGGRKEETARKLATAFRDGRWIDVRSFRRNSNPDASCWFADEDWWLSTNILTEV